MPLPRPSGLRLSRLQYVRTGLALGLMLLGLSPATQAQDTIRSLTQDFPKLSAKERARIAAREADESKQDKAYQGVMQAGETAFQEGHYEEAMQLYEHARVMRPYNVYPKVKIEDLKALIAKQSAGQNGPGPSEPVHLPPQSPAERPSTGPPPPSEQQGMVDHGHGQRPSTDAEIVKNEPAGGTPATEPSSTDTSRPFPLKKAEGVIERRYKDGRAFVIERVVRVDGRSVTYKRVYHPFGQVFYFEDGLSVDERIWKARFEGR